MKGVPSAAMPATVRSMTSLMISETCSLETIPAGLWAPMPPVFGPASSSPIRL